MKKLGVIGGLGPMATAYFYQLVVQMTDAATDQEHFETIIYSNPLTPDRTGFILGRSSEDPMPYLLRSGLELKRQGVDVIAVPCMTAHFFQQRLETELGVKVIHAIREAGRHLKQVGINKVGVIATDGTVETGLFQDAMSQFGIECLTPDASRQKNVMHLIYDDIKAGKPAEMDFFHDISDSLFERGAQAVLLGCTEISLIKRDHELGKGFLDVMEVLAQQSVLTCGKLRKEYEELISE